MEFFPASWSVWPTTGKENVPCPINGMPLACVKVVHLLIGQWFTPEVVGAIRLKKLPYKIMFHESLFDTKLVKPKAFCLKFDSLRHQT